MDAFLTSTLTVSLAELGDKTQLLSLFLAVRFRNKTALIAGILVATLINHAASAWLGNWLTQFLTGDLGKGILAASFIGMALWLLIPDKESDVPKTLDKYGPFVVATVLFFLAEIGDKTQIATVALAAQYESVFWVTLGTTMGMLIANVPVIYAGEALMRKIPFHYTRIAASAVFALVGLIIWFQ